MKLAASAAAAVNLDQQFLNYVSLYGKSYATRDEYEFRLATFQKNLDFINEYNTANPDEAVLGINSMADWTEYEFKQLLGYKPELKKSNKRVFEGPEDISALPDSIDWREQGAVTPVKNQGSCGSCWAFSTTGSLEGRYQIKTGTLDSFSEQQLVDCSTENHGCGGGLMDLAFKYLETTAADTESDYPYIGRGEKCKITSDDQGVTKVANFTDVKSKSPSSLAAALVDGPVSIAIDAMRLQLYFGGVIKHLCGKRLDHGVLLVGYGEEKKKKKSTPYWLVKNSWGTGWGEKGYFKIERKMDEGKPGVCGLLLEPSFPDL